MNTNDLHPLGRIVRLQIQRASLTVGEAPHDWYDASALQAVDELVLTPDGALVRLPDGGEQLDLHHIAHLESHNRRGKNDLSLNFTSHYARIRDRYGSRLRDGCAGENILVEAAQLVGLPRLERGVAIQPAAGGELVWLRRTMVASPCRPFSTFVARPDGDAAVLKSALQFLDGGTRGFYCVLEEPERAVVAVGDTVLVPG
jgi:hypothetical protein